MFPSFSLSKYMCITEMMRILSLVCGHLPEGDWMAPPQNFINYPEHTLSIHYLFGAKHEIIFKHMNYRSWESDIFLNIKCNSAKFSVFLVLQFFCLYAISCKQYYGIVKIMESSFQHISQTFYFLIYLMTLIKV